MAFRDDDDDDDEEKSVDSNLPRIKDPTAAA